MSGNRHTCATAEVGTSEDLTTQRLADLGHEVHRRWERVSDREEGLLDERIALGIDLQEAWDLVNGSKNKFGRWLTDIGWKKTRRTAHTHRMLAVHEDKVRQLFRTQGPNGEFNYKVALELADRAPEYVEAVCAGELTAQQALTKKAQQEEQKLREPTLAKVPADASGPGWQMLEGDCLDRLLEIPEGVADLVFFDPPYNPTSLELTEKAVKALTRPMVDQGLLALLTGQMSLPQLFFALDAHLTYGWTYAVAFKNSRLSYIFGRHVHQAWKPVVVYSKGTWPSSRIEPHRDVLFDVAKSKSRHRWEQNPDIAKWVIQNLCPPGGVVLDPMACTASVGVAALESGRQFIGIEADHDSFLGCVERLESSEP